MDIVNWNLAGPCTYCKYGARDSEVRADKVRRAPIIIHVSVLFISLYCVCCPLMNPLPQAQLTRYRELYKILTDTVPGAADSDYSQMPYDELCEWCVGEMEPVFRWLVSVKYFLGFIKYFSIATAM